MVREVREVRAGDKEVTEAVTVAAQEEDLQEAVQLLLDMEPLDDRSVAIPSSAQYFCHPLLVLLLFLTVSKHKYSCDHDLKLHSYSRHRVILASRI